MPENLSSTVLPVHEMLGEPRKLTPTSDNRKTQTPRGCKYRYYAKRLALKLSLSTKFRKMTSEFLQSKIKILFFKEGSWGWGRDVPSSIETKPEQILHKYYTVHNNILNNGHNIFTLP